MKGVEAHKGGASQKASREAVPHLLTQSDSPVPAWADGVATEKGGGSQERRWVEGVSSLRRGECEVASRRPGGDAQSHGRLREVYLQLASLRAAQSAVISTNVETYLGT